MHLLLELVSIFLVHPLHLHRIQECGHGVTFFKFHVFLVQLDHLIECTEVTHDAITAAELSVELLLIFTFLNCEMMIEVCEALIQGL